MPVAPIKTPTVTPIDVNVRQRDSSNPEAFGIGLGQSLQQTGSMLAQVAAHRQREDDNAAVKAKLSEYRQYKMNRMYHDDDAFYSRQGRSAYDSMGAMQQELDDERKRMLSDLGAGRQQDNFNLLSQQHLDAELEQMNRYGMVNRNKWLNDEDDASIKTEVEEGSLNYADNEQSSQRIKDITTVVANRNGWSDERRDLEARNATTVMHKQAIDNMIANNDTAGARSYFEAAKERGEINPSMYDDIDRSLKESGSAQIATQVRDTVMATVGAGGGTLSDARAKVKELIPADQPEAQAAALRMVEHEYKVRLDSEQIVQADIIDEIEKMKVDDPNFDVGAWVADKTSPEHAAILDKWNSLTGTQQKQLLAFNAIETNWIVYDEVERMVEAGDIKTVGELRKYGAQIAPSDMKVLVKQWDNTGTIPLNELKGIWRSYGGRVGTDGNPLNENEAIEWNAYKDYIYARLKDERTPGDVDTWTQQWLMSGEPSQTEWLRNDAEKFSEAVRRGQSGIRDNRPTGFDFDLPTTESESDIRNVMSMSGVNMAGTTTGNMYFNWYAPARSWLSRHDMPESDAYIATVIYLRVNKKAVTEATVREAISEAYNRPTVSP